MIPSPGQGVLAAALGSIPQKNRRPERARWQDIGEIFHLLPFQGGNSCCVLRPRAARSTACPGLGLVPFQGGPIVGINFHFGCGDVAIGIYERQKKNRNH